MFSVKILGKPPKVTSAFKYHDILALITNKEVTIHFKDDQPIRKCIQVCQIKDNLSEFFKYN